MNSDSEIMKKAADLHPNLKSLFIQIVDSLDSQVNEYKNKVNNKKEEYFVVLNSDLNKLNIDKENIENEIENFIGENNPADVKEKIKRIDKSVLLRSKLERFISDINIVKKNYIDSLKKKSISEILSLKSIEHTKNPKVEDENKANDEEDLTEKLKMLMIFNFEDRPASKLPINKCYMCCGKLDWGTKYNKRSGLVLAICKFTKECNSNYRYFCEPCKQNYCTNCMCAQVPNQCGCGKDMTYKVLTANSCDICRKSVSSSSPALRCQDCDFDKCVDCYNKLVDIHNSDDNDDNFGETKKIFKKLEKDKDVIKDGTLWY